MPGGMSIPKMGISTPAPPLPARLRPAAAPSPSTAQVMSVLSLAVADLKSAESSLEATSLCLGALFRAFPARAALAHVVDPSTGEFAITCALGEDADRLLMTREPISDWVLAAAFFSKRPIVIDHGPLGAAPPERHAFFGQVRGAVVVPILAADGTPLGALELVDTARSAMVDRRTLTAAGELADACAVFFEEHGVQLRNVVLPSGMLPPADPVSDELVEMRARADSTPEVDPRATIPDLEVVEAIEVMRRTG